MAEIAFHFGAPDRLAYTCRLLRKATATGVRVLVIASEDDLLQLDQALWAVSPTDFLSHCRHDAAPGMLARSSVVLATACPQPRGAAAVLVNLGAEIPAGFDHFDRVIEVVGLDEQERNQARARWRGYTQAGYSIVRHDLTQR